MIAANETEPPPQPEEPDASAPPAEEVESRTARLRQQAVDLSARTATQIEHRRQDLLPVDLAVLYYERDREALASVLGSAVALRLYLFIISAMIMTVGFASTVLGKDRVDQMLSDATVSGTMAKDISDATSGSIGAGIVLVLTGVWLVLWTGRNLTKVLAACAVRSWRMDATEAKARMTAIGALCGLFIGIVFVTLFLSRVRDKHGFAAGATSWMVMGVVFAVAWFVISWFLPRDTPDPGALLPGAAFVGVALAILQWFMQFYLPNKISRSSDLAGELGTTMAALGYLFFVGRIMASSFVIDAVLFERVGSISRFVFGLPVIRIIPRRYPVVARFFDLPVPDAEAEAQTTPDNETGTEASGP